MNIPLYAFMFAFIYTLFFCFRTMANLIDQCFISPGIGLHNVDIVGEMLVHLRENNYYKDHFCKVCTGNMAQVCSDR